MIRTCDTFSKLLRLLNVFSLLNLKLEQKIAKELYLCAVFNSTELYQPSTHSKQQKSDFIVFIVNLILKT